MKSIKAGLLLSMVTLSSAAFADTYQLIDGGLNSVYPTSGLFSIDSQQPGATVKTLTWFANVNESGSFSQTYNFSLSASETVSALIGGVPSGFSGSVSSPVYGNFTLTGNNPALPSASNISFTLDGIAGTAGSLLSEQLSAGSHSLIVSGSSQGNINLYGAQLTFALNDVSAPVPEPAEWALMIAGLGLISWRLRNGQDQSAKQSAVAFA